MFQKPQVIPWTLSGSPEGQNYSHSNIKIFAFSTVLTFALMVWKNDELNCWCLGNKSKKWNYNILRVIYCHALCIRKKEKTWFTLRRNKLLTLLNLDFWAHIFLISAWQNGKYSWRTSNGCIREKQLSCKLVTFFMKHTFM